MQLFDLNYTEEIIQKPSSTVFLDWFYRIGKLLVLDPQA